MTQQEALAEARRRWGILAKVRRYGRESVCSPAKYAVTELFVRDGMILLGTFGNGSSWEAAFADADRRSESKGEER